MPRFAGIEAGGTKFVCAVGTHPGDLISVEFPTTTPAETIDRAVEFLQSHKPLDSVGIASFGPLDLEPASPTFGYILATPKTDWKNFNFAGAIQGALSVPVAFDTDVNAAALAEARWGAAKSLQTFLYITVGTGIGGGAMIDGKLLHGKSHPEMGHIRVPHNTLQDPFPGNCPYHADCLEGLAAAPAIHARWGQSPDLLPSNHPAWDLEAQYLALGLANWICTLSPQKILLGGGILQREGLLARVRLKLNELLNFYMDAPEIAPPQLGPRAGVLGAIAMAEALVHKHS